MPLTRYASRFTRYVLLSAFFLPALSAFAGDLTVDNLTITTNAAVYGALNMQSIVTSTNGATATGGTITTNGGYCIHTFTNSGTFTVSGGSITCDVLIVAGGGGGGYATGAAGGGGGGGGMIETNCVYVSGNISVVVGAGGGGGSGANSGVGTNGGNSAFGEIEAIGGGGGSGYGTYAAADGGSGGGAGALNGGANTHGHGTSGQGYNGGDSKTGGGGGGGGGGSVGETSPAIYNGGDGGSGKSSDISGTTVYYAGGGAGACCCQTPGDGGVGGGGSGGKAVPIIAGGSGSNGFGAGGGGSYYTNAGSGGSGIVIVRYLGAAGSNSDSYVTTLTISSNGISQANASGSNVFMGKVGIGTSTPAEKLHVAGNLRVDGTSIVSAVNLGGVPITNWSSFATGALIASNNLSDVVDKVAARTNLGLGSAATNEAGVFLSPTSDGSQLTNITAAQVGALSTNAGALIAANNLSDVNNAGTARDNLGLGSAATNEISAFLSATGGVVNGVISFVSPAGDIPVGVYTNQ